MLTKLNKWGEINKKKERKDKFRKHHFISGRQKKLVEKNRVG